MENDTFQFGLALVTAKGLLFSNRYFTNQGMVRSKWFETAGREGDWQIPVLYCKAFPTKLFLFDINTVEIATAIENEKTNVSL
jgi:hypothetical protein